MQLALLWNHKDKTRILARLAFLEDIDEENEPEEEKESTSKVDGGSKTIRTGFHASL